MTAPMSFEYDCIGLVALVQRAADPTSADWSPYFGYVVGRAVWQAKYCAHRARVLGLIPVAEIPAATEAA